NEIYLQSFPKPGVKQQVSNAGGRVPRWSRDGRELFYLGADEALMAVSVKPAGSSIEVSVPKSLFQTRGNRPGYDVTADGKFLMSIPDLEQTPEPITVILNWASGLKK